MREMELSQQQKKRFDDLKHIIDGVEYWNARELMPHVGYANWREFENVINKAKTDCLVGGESVDKHFLDATPKNAGNRGRPGSNYHLTRYACYLVLQNGNSAKPEIAAAHRYFSIQTRRQELNDRRASDWQRLDARQRLTSAEADFNSTLYGHGLNTGEVATVRSKGDEVFFGGSNTAAMKKKMKVPEGRALADYLPTISINGKAFIASMTTLNTETKNLIGRKEVEYEHKENSAYVRNALELRDIQPEDLPAETDIQQVKIRLGLSRGPRKSMAPGQLSLNFE